MIKSLHGTFTETSRDVTKFSEALKRLGLWEPHGWSHLDHDSLFGQVSLVMLLSLQPSCCFGRLLLFGPQVAGWSDFALGPFGHVSLFGAGSLLNHISLFGPFGHVSLFGTRSLMGPRVQSTTLLTEAPRNITKFFPTAEQVGWWQPIGW